MLKSRTMAVAGTLAALTLATAPIAAAATDAHSGPASPDRMHRVEKKSPDRTSRDRDHTRDAKTDR